MLISRFFAQHLKSRGVDYFVSGSGSFNGVFRELPQSRFGSIENGFTAHRIRHDHMDVSVINLSGNTLYRARVSPPDEAPLHIRHWAPPS